MLGDHFGKPGNSAGGMQGCDLYNICYNNGNKSVNINDTFPGLG